MNTRQMQRIIRDAMRAAGTAALIQGCAHSGSGDPAHQPSTPPDPGTLSTDADASIEHSANGGTPTAEPVRKKRRHIYEAPWDPNCWWENNWNEGPIVTEVRIQVTEWTRIRGAADCALACPLPPTEVSAPFDTPVGAYGRRKVTTYERLPCEEDKQTFEKFCRFIKKESFQSNDNCIQIGRRTLGMRLDEQTETHEPAAWLSYAAALEAASVRAFEEVARHLVRFGAPGHLVRDALRSAQDERRHARIVGALAKSFGGALRPPSFEDHGAPSIEDFAVENAVEGCVRETAGAVHARWQAEHAASRRIRRAFQAIAEDEARHASLAWRIHHWLCTRLDMSAARQGMAVAIQGLWSAAPAEPALVSTLGLPDPQESKAILRRLMLSLWSDVLSEAPVGVT